MNTEYQMKSRFATEMFKHRTSLLLAIQSKHRRISHSCVKEQALTNASQFAINKTAQPITQNRFVYSAVECRIEVHGHSGQDGYSEATVARSERLLQALGC